MTENIWEFIMWNPYLGSFIPEKRESISQTRAVGPLILIWFYFNPCIYKKLQVRWSVGRNFFSIPKLQRLHSKKKLKWILFQPTLHNPRYVHLTCGGNDLSSKSPENVRKDYDDLINEVRRCCPDAVITLNTLPPRRRDIRLNERIKQLNDYIRNRATRGDGVKCHDDYPQFPKCFSPDQVHFNKAGKHVYARQLADYYVNFPLLFISEPR